MPSAQAHVIWARCDEPAHLDQVAALQTLLEADGDKVTFICTLPEPSGTSAIVAPNGQRAVRSFLLAHEPVAMLWIGGIIDQASLAPCYDFELPVMALEGSDRMLSRVMGSWMPHRARATLAKLHAVFALSPRIKREFMAGGAPEEIITVAGSISEASVVLPYREDDRVDLAQALGTRPVWLAAGATPRDVLMLCDAHKEAVRQAHRLLLIIAPHNGRDGPEIAAMCKGAGWNTAVRSTGEEPGEATQIYLADDEDGMGLWYRLSPSCFLAGSFGEGACDDPFHAAALGSVVMHGPSHGQFGTRFTQLIEAEATVPLEHPDDLGRAVAQLMAVDKAAEQANAGWDVTSRGAGAALLVAAKIQALLDGEGR